MSDENPTATVKAHVIEVDADLSNATASTEDDQRIFNDYGAIVPPYDPRSLSLMYERSTALRPNIDAYATNIEAFGYRLEPTIDLKADDVDQAIADALMLEKFADDDPTPNAPSEEIAGTKLTLEAQMRMEKLRTEQFFKNICSDMSFIELRERTRNDLEITGNAYWEVLRDGAGRICQFVHLPSISMRLIRADSQYTEVDEERKVSALSYRRFRVKRRFRQFVQVVYGQFNAFFKELGDPRVISAKTGHVYATMDDFRREDETAPCATEVVHFKIPSPSTAYGVPRWIGATLAVLGSRESEEVNVTYFNNKAVPPLAVLVSGGALAKGAADRITNYIRDNIKGKDNFHKVLVLEAEPAGGSLAAQGNRVRIEIKNLMDAQNTDALFQTYEANNTEKVGNQFRIPKLLRGDTKDFNRATADAALQYAEQQVFQPERNKIDHFINRRILPLLGCRFFEFKSNSPVTTDPPVLATMIQGHADKGIITPEEAREFSAGVFGKPLKKLEAEWTKQPLQITLAQAGGVPPGTGVQARSPDTLGDPPDIGPPDDRLVQLRSQLAAVEGQLLQATLDAAREVDAKRTILVPQTEWTQWFAPDAE